MGCFRATVSFSISFALAVLWAITSAPPTYAQDDHGFRFVRIKYDNAFDGRRSRGGDPWSHDYPRAELHLYEALERTTLIHVEGPPLVLELSDDRIFEYPVLYLCEPGYWRMTDEELRNLQEYLKRGGFILFDDFRGQGEWERLKAELARLFPGREPVELPPDHFVWSIYYDVDPVAAPSLVSGGFGFDLFEDRYFGLFDDDGRMMALLCYNQDIGDGWEWPEQNIEDASTTAFQMGINFLLYALTH